MSSGALALHAKSLRNLGGDGWRAQVEGICLEECVLGHLYFLWNRRLDSLLRLWGEGITWDTRRGFHVGTVCQRSGKRLLLGIHTVIIIYNRELETHSHLLRVKGINVRWCQWTWLYTSFGSATVWRRNRKVSAQTDSALHNDLASEAHWLESFPNWVLF